MTSARLLLQRPQRLGSHLVLASRPSLSEWGTSGIIVSLFVQVLSHSLFLLPVTCLTLNNHISLPPAATGTLHYMHGVSPCPIPIPLFSTSQYMQKTSLLQVQGLQGACFHCQRFGCDARWPQVSQGGALFMDGCCMRHAELSHLL